MTDFVREPRYFVAKWTDMIAGLTLEERKEIIRLGNKVHEYRITHGKRPFNCAVVEDDWPEYELVWDAIEKRVTGQTKKDAELKELWELYG